MYINIPERTLEDWITKLTPSEMQGILEFQDWELEDELTPGEILEALIEWYGGLATAYQVKSLINRIYGIEL